MLCFILHHASEMQYQALFTKCNIMYESDLQALYFCCSEIKGQISYLLQISNRHHMIVGHPHHQTALLPDIVDTRI